MNIQEIMEMIVIEYVNVVENLPDTDEAWNLWWEILNQMKQKNDSLFYQKVILALTQEGLVPGQSLGTIKTHELLPFAEIKQIMNVMYKCIWRSNGKAIPELRQKYEGINFAEKLLDAYEVVYPC